jgi:hypothetical protein
VSENRDALLFLAALITLWGLIIVTSTVIGDILISMIQAWSAV